MIRSNSLPTGRTSNTDRHWIVGGNGLSLSGCRTCVENFFGHVIEDISGNFDPAEVTCPAVWVVPATVH